MTCLPPSVSIFIYFSYTTYSKGGTLSTSLLDVFALGLRTPTVFSDDWHVPP